MDVLLSTSRATFISQRSNQLNCDKEQFKILLITISMSLVSAHIYKYGNDLCWQKPQILEWKGTVFFSLEDCHLLPCFPFLFFVFRFPY